jgi:hypothetical protein
MRLVFALTLLLGMLQAMATRAQPLSYYIVVGHVTNDKGKHDAFTARVRTLFIELLRKRSDIALDAPAWLPTETNAMRAELAKHNVRAYEGSVKIDRLTVTNKSNQIFVDLKLSLFGVNLPDRLLKFGGSGETITSVRIAVGQDKKAATDKLLDDAIVDALAEAVKATERKIQLVVAEERKHL